jgi:hypothetical protein
MDFPYCGCHHCAEVLFPAKKFDGVRVIESGAENFNSAGFKRRHGFIGRPQIGYQNVHFLDRTDQ